MDQVILQDWLKPRAANGRSWGKLAMKPEDINLTEYGSCCFGGGRFMSANRPVFVPPKSFVLVAAQSSIGDNNEARYDYKLLATTDIEPNDYTLTIVSETQLLNAVFQAIKIGGIVPDHRRKYAMKNVPYMAAVYAYLGITEQLSEVVKAPAARVTAKSLGLPARGIRIDRGLMLPKQTKPKPDLADPFEDEEQR